MIDHAMSSDLRFPWGIPLFLSPAFSSQEPAAFYTRGPRSIHKVPYVSSRQYQPPADIKRLCAQRVVYELLYEFDQSRKSFNNLSNSIGLGEKSRVLRTSEVTWENLDVIEKNIFE